MPRKKIMIPNRESTGNESLEAFVEVMHPLLLTAATKLTKTTTFPEALMVLHEVQVGMKEATVLALKRRMM